MNWKNFKLGTKFTLAFGTITLILILFAIWTITGIGGILHNANEVIDGNKLRALLGEKYTQHMKWAQDVNKLLTDKNVKELHVQTDHTKCEFGKWYYGPERKKAEELVPELKSTITEMEDPHMKLHQSAIHIDEIFEQVDWQLALSLRQSKLDHVSWMNKVKDAIFIKNLSTIDVISDPTMCNFGKWLASEEVRTLEKDHPETVAILDKIRSAHSKLHTSVIQAEQYQKNRQNGLAKAFYQNTIEQNATTTLAEIDNLTQWFETDLKGMEEANRIYNSETMVELDRIGKLFDKLINDSKNYIMTDDVMVQKATNTRFAIVVFSIIAALLSVVLATVIARGILNPIKKSIVFAKLLSEGDLTATVDIDQEDEIGQLTSALNDMSDRLRNIVADITSGADNIASASQQISSSSQELSQGANEQASSVEEVSSTMEQIAANIEQNTENAGQTEKIAATATQGIREVSNQSNETVSANKLISEKISIITDIAFQTNILALNAAVEAARAGEHGKGFAVVAAEVRKLAERSKEAAGEIIGLAKNSLDLAELAGKKMEAILPDVEKTTQLVQEISSASLEQNNGATQVNGAIQQLNTIVQQYAASSEELATSSEEMNSQADQLRDVIGFFKTGQNGKRALVRNRSKSAENLVVNKKETTKPTVLTNKKSNQKIDSDTDFEQF